MSKKLVVSVDFELEINDKSVVEYHDNMTPFIKQETKNETIELLKGYIKKDFISEEDEGEIVSLNVNLEVVDEEELKKEAELFNVMLDGFMKKVLEKEEKEGNKNE